MQTFSLSVLIWMALGISLAVFSLVIEVTSFSRMVILKDRVQLILNKSLVFKNTLYVYSVLNGIFYILDTQ